MKSSYTEGFASAIVSAIHFATLVSLARSKQSLQRDSINLNANNVCR